MLNSIQLKKLNNLQGLAGGVHVDGGEVLGEREVAELALHVVVCLFQGTIRTFLDKMPFLWTFRTRCSFWDNEDLLPFWGHLRPDAYFVTIRI